MKIQNIPLKIAIFLASAFATIAAVFGFRAHYEQQKNTQTQNNAEDYVKDLLESEIVEAQRAQAMERDKQLQEAAHTPQTTVTQQEEITTVTPIKVVEPVVQEKPKSTKKTKSS